MQHGRINPRAIFCRATNCLYVHTDGAVNLLGGVLLAVGQHDLLNLQGQKQMHTLRKVLLLRCWYIDMMQSGPMRAIFLCTGHHMAIASVLAGVGCRNLASSKKKRKCTPQTFMLRQGCKPCFDAVHPTSPYTLKTSCSFSSDTVSGRPPTKMDLT